MKIKQDFPHRVREIENQWITLADGTRLAARIWLPKNAEAAPVPAILEYLPYRKRDGTAARDELTHPWLAGHGYACVRVDMRGNGESDGLMEDEYAPQEQADALEVIDWIAAQPWCSGKLGMMGISWGASTACNWPRSDPNRSRRSSPCAPPTTATPTISTTRAATCCWRIWAGRRPC
ncbi:CocE/NonD family hydrolase [Salinicola sp. JS01]|nr:CocE/NonD family hydrolase [Salinicola sp. JS01]WIX33712.1 CocE/NonD family hydrolase [Salinicola sp. JS01]